MIYKKLGLLRVILTYELRVNWDKSLAEGSFCKQSPKNIWDLERYNKNIM